MAQFPAKFLSILPDLDDESACLVIFNNLSGLSASEKSLLRPMLDSKTPSVVTPLLNFKTQQNVDSLIETLRNLLQPAAPEIIPKEADIEPVSKDPENNQLNQSGDLGTSTIKVLQDNILTYDTQLSISFNSQKQDEHEDLTKKAIGNQKLVDNLEMTEKERELNKTPNGIDERKKRLQMTEAKFRHLLNESKEAIKPEKIDLVSNSKAIMENLCRPLAEMNVHDSKIKIFTESPSKPKIQINTSNMISEDSMKKNTFRATLGAISNLVLNAPVDSRTFAKTNTFGPNNDSKVEKMPQPLASPAFSGLQRKSFDFSIGENEAITGNEENEPKDDLISTVQTEELFKKYIQESRKEEKKDSTSSKANSSLLEIGYDTLLRYTDSWKLFALLQTRAKTKNNELTREEFTAVIDDVIVQAFGKSSDIVKLNTIYDTINSENKMTVNMDKIYGGLSLFCKGTCEDKMRASFSHMATNNYTDRNISYASVALFVESVFKILMSFVPNPAKTAQISISELCEMTAKQCFEDNYQPITGTIQVQDIVRWFSTHAISLAPTQQNILENENSLEADDLLNNEPLEAKQQNNSARFRQENMFPQYFTPMQFAPWGMPYIVPPQMYCYGPPQGFPYMGPPPNVAQTPYRFNRNMEYYGMLTEAKMDSENSGNYSPQNVSWREMISNTSASTRQHSRKSSMQKLSEAQPMIPAVMMTPSRKSNMPMCAGTTLKRGDRLKPVNNRPLI